MSEREPEAVWGALADAKLAALVDLARAKSPFHRERLGAAPVLTRADLVKLPVLDKDAWMAASPPRSTAALTRRLAGAYVFRTGGSTGDPKFSVFSTGEFRAFVKYFKRTYQAAGLRPTDRVANLFACGSLYASFIFVNRMLEATGCLNFPFTTATEPAAVARHVKLFGINTLVGFPSWLLQVADALEAEGVGVEKIFYAGEHLYPDERRHLAERLGARVIASAGYAAVDAGMVGYQCEAAGPGAVHHVLADHAHLELLDPQTWQPAAEGLVVVTNLDRRLQPVIRYNVGDLARHVPGDCACGRTAPRFELLHRGDDALRIGFATLTYTEVVAALAGLPVGAVQLQRERLDRKDRLTLRVETREAIAPAAVVRALEAAKPDLAKLLASGYLHPLAVEFLPPGGIPRLPVSGKLRRVVDLAGL
ncbi:MAG: Coenzyme synthetase-like protein [Cyanobacteria bacterium RYN_339]|nr:Coenzyme synthetase-like protein [Cyanobacteria bacterium RYN_339]